MPSLTTCGVSFSSFPAQPNVDVRNTVIIVPSLSRPRRSFDCAYGSLRAQRTRLAINQASSPEVHWWWSLCDSPGYSIRWEIFSVAPVYLDERVFRQYTFRPPLPVPTMSGQKHDAAFCNDHGMLIARRAVSCIVSKHRYTTKTFHHRVTHAYVLSFSLSTPDRLATQCSDAPS